MATSRVTQKIFCNGTQAKILVPNLKLGHCELSSGLVKNGGNSRAGNHRPYHSSLHASRSEQFLVIDGENFAFREKQQEDNAVHKSLKTITGQLGAQVLNKAYKLSNNIVEWANNLNRRQTLIVEEELIEKSPRLSRRCRSCDPRHLKSETVEATTASRFQKKDSNKILVHKFGSAVEAVKPSLRDNLNSSFYSVLSTQPHRGYSKLREKTVPQEECRKDDENPNSNLNKSKTSICLYSNLELDKKDESALDSESLSKTENARNKLQAGENKERNSKQKCYPMSRNFSFAFFQPLTNAHFFTTLSQCQLDTESNECPRTLFAPQYFAMEQNFLCRINESKESSMAVGNALVNKARGIPQRVFRIALHSCYKDIDKTKSINETILNKLIYNCKSFLGPSLLPVKINGGELVASKSSISTDIISSYKNNNLVRIDNFKDSCQNNELKPVEEDIKDNCENGGVVTVEGKMFKTSDETLNKLLLLVKQTKIAQENCLENPILDQILSPSILRKQVGEKIDLLSSSVDLASDLLPNMKRNPLSQMNHVSSSSKNDLKFCGEFFTEDLNGGVEFENLKVKPPVSEKSIYRVLKAFKDIVRDDSSSIIINTETYSSHTNESVVVDGAMNESEVVTSRNNIIYNSENGEKYKINENVPEEHFDHVNIDDELINRLTSTADLFKFGKDMCRSYPTFFQSIPQKNSELMLQCNSMRLHSFIANYNPNIRRASNLANNSNMNLQKKGLNKSHLSVFKPTQSNNLMQIDRSISKVGKTLNSKKKISSQALINIFNENFNLKFKTNDFPDNITLYNIYNDDRFDKMREVVVSRASSTYKSLLAGSSSLKVFAAENQKSESIKMPMKNNVKTKTSLNLEKLVFKPRSVGTVISSLDSSSAQLNRSRNLNNMDSVVTSENNSSYFKTNGGENEVTRINKLNKLGKKLASSTKKEVRYSWRSDNVAMSSSSTTNNRENISNTSDTKSSSYILKSNDLRIFMPEKKRNIESLTGEENFHGRRKFGILKSGHVDSKSYRDVPRTKNVSFNSLRTKTVLENDIIPEMSNAGSNKGFSLLHINNDSAAKFSTRPSDFQNDQKNSTAETKFRGKDSFLKIDIGGERKIAFDDKEQIDNFKLMKPYNKVVKQSDGITKLNRYARKLRHSIKYGAVFSDLDNSSAQKKTLGNLVGAINLRKTGNKTKSNNKSTLIAKPQEVSNPFRIPLEIKDKDVALQPDQIENIRERLMSDRSKMSKLYRGPAQNDLNLLDQNFVLSKTEELERENEGSKYFSNIFKRGGSLSGGSSSNKPQSSKNKKKNSSVGKVESIENKSLNIPSNNMEKSSMKMIGDYKNFIRDAYKSDRAINEITNNRNSSMKGYNKVSSIELMRSVRSDRRSESLSTEYLVRPYPTESTQKDESHFLFSTEKSNVGVLKQSNASNSANDNRIGYEVKKSLTKNLPTSYTSEKSQSIKINIEQNPIKIDSSEEKRSSFSGIKAREIESNVRSGFENKMEKNKLQRDTILKDNEKQKLVIEEPRGRPSTIESFIGNRSKDNNSAPKQKNNANMKINENKKIFNGRAIIAAAPVEGRSKSINERPIDREPVIDVESQQIGNKRQSDNLILSVLWRRDNSKKSLSNHGFKSSDHLESNFRKNVVNTSKSLLLKNNDGSENKGFRSGKSFNLELNTTKAVEFNPYEYEKVSNPDKFSISENEHNGVLSNYEKDNKTISKPEGAESDKIHFEKLIRPNSFPTQTNSIYRSTLTKDRMDGEIRGLEARGLEYNKKKNLAEKTDKETQTPPIVEKSRSRKVQNDKVAGRDGHQFFKSDLKSTSKDVKKAEDKVASSVSFSKRPSSAVLKDTVTLDNTKNHGKPGMQSNSNQSSKYLDRNKPSGDSSGQDRDQTIFEPKLEGYQTMRVFAERRKETEKKKAILIENLENQKELFRSPLSLSKLMQTKSL